MRIPDVGEPCNGSHRGGRAEREGQGYTGWTRLGGRYDELESDLAFAFGTVAGLGFLFVPL